MNKTDQQTEHFDAYPIDKIREYARNPRKHPKDQIKQIVASIDNFGFTNPLLIDKKLRTLSIQLESINESLRNLKKKAKRIFLLKAMNTK